MIIHNFWSRLQGCTICWSLAKYLTFFNSIWTEKLWDWHNGTIIPFSVQFLRRVRDFIAKFIFRAGHKGTYVLHTSSLRPHNYDWPGLKIRSFKFDGSYRHSKARVKKINRIFHGRGGWGWGYNFYFGLHKNTTFRCNHKKIIRLFIKECSWRGCYEKDGKLLSFF